MAADRPTIEVGVNLEYVRHADQSREYGFRRAAEMGFAYVEPCLIQGHCTLSEAGYCHWASMDSVDPRDMRAKLEEVGVEPSAVSAHAQLMRPWAAEHLIKAIRGHGADRRYLSGHNRGGINGWVGRAAIYGVVIEVCD